MRKNLLVTVFALGVFLHSYAGGLLTNTNQNVTFLRNPARDASTEIDAAYTNPAGLAFLKKDGFFISLNNQSAFQSRILTADFAPLEGFGGSSVKEYKGNAKALFVPNIQAAYKTGDWVFSLNGGVVGGGGSLDYKNGLPSFESQVAGNLALLSSAANIPSDYTLDTRLKGTQIIFGLQLGATYKINDNFSAYLGAHASFVDYKYEGYMRNVQMSGKDNLTNYFTTAAATAQYVATSLQPAVGAGYGDATLSQLVQFGLLPQAQLEQMASALGIPSTEVGAYSVNQTIGTFTGLAQQANGAVAGINQLAALDMQLNTKQTGFGVAPIIGLDYNWNGLNIGAKYEFKTSLNLKSKALIPNTTGLPEYNDGATTPCDIPALLTVGAQYDIIQPLTVSVGYHHFFDSNAKMADDKQKLINGGINEYLAGVEYRINKMFLASCGTQFTRSGVTDGYQTDTSYSLNSYSIGLGGAINVTEDIRINLAYFFTNYSDWNISSANYNNTSLPGKESFGRTNKTLGIGVDFRF